MKLQEAVKQETRFVTIGTTGVTVFLIAAFLGLHMAFPKYVPFDAGVVLAGVIGCAVASFNFFWMALTVQKVTSIEEEDRARSTMAVSIRYRYMLQLAWVILALVIHFFNPVTAIVPLFVPSTLIKLRGIFSKSTNN